MSWVRALPGLSHVVLDSPHSGTVYPADFGTICPLTTLRRAEDTHVEKLYAFAPELGCAWVEALFPRSYLDANRNVTEVDPAMLDAPWPHAIDLTEPAVLSKRRLGKGLIWKLTDNGQPLYDRLLSVAEVEQRVASCWVAYHTAVGEAIDAAHAAHGFSIHINCHSMPEVAASHATDFPGERHPDFVLGNRDNTTSSPTLLHWVADELKAKGHSVALNHPYKGVELVRRYGNPPEQRHSLQVEVNRALYMDEKTFETTANFATLQTTLRGVVKGLLGLRASDLA